MSSDFVQWTRRRFLSSALTGSLALAAGSSVGSEESPTRASTSRESHASALQALPLDELREDVRAKVWQVVREPSLYRRLPVEVIDCDPELYIFLVRYPEVVVNMWQLMGITKVQVQRVAPFKLEASDGAGTTSTVELLYGSRDKHLILGSGYYEGPMFRRRINGQCVLLLQSGYMTTPAGRSLVSSRLDIFVTLENVGAEFIAKTLHPLVGRTADHNFSESARFVAQVSQQSENNQPGMQRLTGRLTNVSEEVRRKFSEISGAVGQRTAMRVAAARGDTGEIVRMQ